MKKCELIIIWADGEKERRSFESREKAKAFASDMMRIFGKQIDWIGLDERGKG